MTAILLTRPAGPDDPLAVALRRHGYRVHAVRTVETQPVDFDASHLAAFDWIDVTSVQGVKALAALPEGPRFAAVGEKTAAALRARGVEPAHVPPVANGRALADTLPDVQGRRIALVRASAADHDLPARLRLRGAEVEEISAYTTSEAPAASVGPLGTALADPDLAAVVFASGSAVRGFLALGGDTRLRAITIGPRTTAEARRNGFHVMAEAQAQTAEALAAAVTGALPLEEPQNA
jgi:uroporphyrinogen-III synthase